MYTHTEADHIFNYHHNFILIILFPSKRKHVERNDHLSVKDYSECTRGGRRTELLQHKVKCPHIETVGAVPTPAHWSLSLGRVIMLDFPAHDFNVCHKITVFLLRVLIYHFNEYIWQQRLVSKLLQASKNFQRHHTWPIGASVCTVWKNLWEQWCGEGR